VSGVFALGRRGCERRFRVRVALPLHHPSHLLCLTTIRRTLSRARNGSSMRAAEAQTGFDDGHLSAVCNRVDAVLLTTLVPQFGSEPSDFELQFHARHFYSSQPLAGVRVMCVSVALPFSLTPPPPPLPFTHTCIHTDTYTYTHTLKSPWS
jgi:hypothetical protein